MLKLGGNNSLKIFKTQKGFQRFSPFAHPTWSFSPPSFHLARFWGRGIHWTLLLITGAIYWAMTMWQCAKSIIVSSFSANDYHHHPHLPNEETEASSVSSKWFTQVPYLQAETTKPDPNLGLPDFPWWHPHSTATFIHWPVFTHSDHPIWNCSYQYCAKMQEL